jgi:hypothetical protein
VQHVPRDIISCDHRKLKTLQQTNEKLKRIIDARLTVQSREREKRCQSLTH